MRRYAVGVTLWTSVFTLAACNPHPDAPAQVTPGTEIAFKKHGDLEVLREGKPLLTLSIEIADDDSARMRGMMQRTGFPDMTGMLFIFPYEDMQSFWMANTPLPLDILFVSADSQIVDIHRYTRPLSPEHVNSTAPARFVLEVPAGFCDTYGIVESDRLRWSRLDS